MRHKVSRISLSLIVAACTLPLLVDARNANEEIAARLSAAQLQQLAVLEGLSLAGLNEVEEATTGEQLRRRTAELLALDLPAVGSRHVDAEGRSPIHHYIESAIQSLEDQGVEHLGVLRDRVAAPVAVDRLLDSALREEPSTVAIDGETLPVFPLWPNGHMPALTPREGLAGPLLYAGSSEWEELSGLPVDGAIMVMEFNGGRRIERLFSLGAKAVIVVPDQFVSHDNANLLFTATPFPFPRFFAAAEQAERLRDMALENNRAHAAGRNPTSAILRGGALYEERPTESHFAYLPPSEPVVFEVRVDSLLAMIAADYGMSTSDMLRANDLVSAALEVGQRLLIPGGGGSYVVRENDLLDRVAQIYASDRQAILQASGIAAEGIAPGTRLIIPNESTPIVISVHMDAASVVPDVPHGARAMMNLAAALNLMEHLATSEFLNRRRGVIFAFMDGDTLGGMGSRLLADYLHRQTAALATAGGSRGMNDAELLQAYREAYAWMRDGESIENSKTAQWMVDDWLMGHLEDARIALAEQRIPLILGINASSDPAEISNKREQLEAIEKELRAVVDVRLESLALRVSATEQLAALQRIFDDPQMQPLLQRHDINRQRLLSQFRAELQELEILQSNHDNNNAVAMRLLEYVQGGRRGTLRLGFHLDILDGSTQTGINVGMRDGETMRAAPRGGALARQLAPRLRTVAAYTANLAGWDEEFLFISTEDSANLPSTPTRTPVLYDDFWRFADVLLLPLGGVNDRTPLLDTPADTLDSIQFGRASIQARTVTTMVRLAVESPIDSTVDSNVTLPELSRLSGRAVQFNIRSGIDAQEPVAGAYVFLPFSNPNAGAALPNAQGFFGYRRGVVATTGRRGVFRLPVEIANYHGSPVVTAARLDRDLALFTKVMTQGQVGTRAQANPFQYRRSAEVERNLVMIDAYPKVIFPGDDPHTFQSIGGAPRAPVRMELMDAVREGAPRDFAVDNPLPLYRERDTEGVVIYAPVGERIRALVRSGPSFRMLLVGEVDSSRTSGRGAGMLIGPDGDDRNLYLALTPHHIGRQMVDLARDRVETYRRFGIASRSLDAALQRAEEKMELADAAILEGDWREAIGSSREAWGIIVKNYPRVLRLGREAVFSVILLMAFLVPSAWFLQSLVGKAKGIVSKLGWTVLLFFMGTLFLNYFHPAFQIAMSPFIVVIAFTMILMSTIVIGLSYQRFEVLLRRFRSASGQVESEEISFFSSLGTAFSLGISNLRKRMFRTALTTLTVTVLTFSIIAFVAITGQDTVNRTPVALDTFVDGQAVEPIAPQYEGMLLRNFQWQEFPRSQVTALQTEFGGDLDLTVRAHYLEVEGGNQAAREGVNQIPLGYDGERHVVSGVMVLQANEPQFSGLHQAVSGNIWFSEDHRYHVIIPDEAAATLGITHAQLLSADGSLLPEAELPKVTMNAREWTVIGILDTQLANRMRDINGRSLAMVDYLRSGMSPAVSGQLEQEGESYHMNWERLVIVPWLALNDVGAKIRSVALRFPPDLDQQQFFNDIAMRFKGPFFAHAEGETSFIVPRQKLDMAGLAKVLLPIILCILIVMNTMLGTVEERKGEVGMLGAIGLSPRQISFLMFSESTVFSIIGILLGTFGGLLFSNVVEGLNSAGIQFLSGLSFNFTSLLSMALAMGTGAVVLVATLIPARKAAALAAPSGMAEWQLPEPDGDGVIRFELPFTLTRGNVVGMVAFFRRFLLNHTESTSEDFNCREVGMESLVVDGDPALAVTTDMWLMPYDLDVAQHFRMTLHPGTTAGVYVVSLTLTRFSGSEENWTRTCYRFLNLVRQQFLFWRNLSPEARTGYIEEGARLVSELETNPLEKA